jgi:transposase
MAAIEVTRKDFTTTELRAASRKARDAKAARRMLAIALVIEGKNRRTAAETCGMDRQTLRDWVHRYNAEGLAGLKNRKAPGRPSRLTAQQKAELATLVEKGPDAEQDGVVRWRCTDLKRRIEEMFGVKLHERTVGKQLKALGYVRLSVRPQHPKSDPQARRRGAWRWCSAGHWPGLKTNIAAVQGCMARECLNGCHCPCDNCSQNRPTFMPASSFS